jgi:RimJ/RimL family protein N-acetyltransferase
MNAPIHLPPSTRLRYRLMDGSDAPLLFELDQDPEVMRYLNDSKPSTWDEVERFFVPRITRFTDPATACGLWEVRTRQQGEYLGWILVRQYGFDTHYHEADNIELGWRLKRHCWGQGIATEAATAAVRVLRRQSGIRAFSAVADPANLGSIGVMKKLGMRYVDNRLHHTPLRDFDVAYYEMPNSATSE